MRRMAKMTVAATGMALALAASAQSQHVAISSHVMTFAKTSLQAYVRDVVNEKNVANFGFKTVGEARRAEVGTPFEVRVVELRALKQYTSASDAPSLLQATGTLWFPVLVEGTVRTKLEVVQKGNELIPGEFGGTNEVGEIARVSGRLATILRDQGITVPTKVELVKVPPLFATFFYATDGGRHLAVPAMVQPQRYGLENGRAYPLADLLAILARYAQQIQADKVM
jgi:hypothetical protein